MRLTQFEIETITKLALKHFGKEAEIFLFGSRVSDKRRGGDIDLFVRNKNGKKPEVRSKINFLTDLMIYLGEQKIDVVLDNPKRKGTGFLKTITQTAIQLC